MSRRRKAGIVIVSLVVYVLVTGLVWAQVDPEVESGERLRRPTISYAVASPRGCLIGARPIINPDTNDVLNCLGPRGEVENFARKPGALKVPTGMRVVFCLSRNMEGVWYPGAFGKMRTSLKLQLRRPYITDPTLVEPNELWITLGEDAAGDVRLGPSIGRCKVGVPVRFRKPGEYLLRAIVTSMARPLRLESNVPAADCDTSMDITLLPGAVDRDVVFIKVKVVDLPLAELTPNEQPTLDPDVENILPMPKEISPDGSTLLDADINGDNRVDLADLAILNQQWGAEQELPLEEWE